jgi:hypothetical protein
LLQNFSNSEINDGLKRMPAAAAASEKSTNKFGVWSLLISVFFIIKGIMYLGKGRFQQTLGIVFLVLGMVGLVIKGIDMAKR